MQPSEQPTVDPSAGIMEVPKEMEKRDYGLTEAWHETVQMMQRSGLLLVSADSTGKPNVMTIGWALLGVIWGKPILTVLVRPSRFSYQMVDTIADFTINVPSPEMDEIVEYCGTTSGKEHDKFAERRLTATPARRAHSPIVAECLLHYECKVIHKGDVDYRILPPEVIANYYQQDDFHRIFFAEVLAVYGVTDFKQRVSGVRR
jgi:flavin reductase (DIM6/NTAB) family NADH-FMN oxidoreductase RutF